MSLFPKFKAAIGSVATSANLATPPSKSSNLSQSSIPRGGEMGIQPSQERAGWPCPHCGTPAEIEAVEPRKDDGVLLTYWHCEPCQTWAVTPATLREPPVWVSRKEQ